MSARCKLWNTTNLIGEEKESETILIIGIGRGIGQALELIAAFQNKAQFGTLLIWIAEFGMAYPTRQVPGLGTPFSGLPNSLLVAPQTLSFKKEWSLFNGFPTRELKH